MGSVGSAAAAATAGRCLFDSISSLLGAGLSAHTSPTHPTPCTQYFLGWIPLIQDVSRELGSEYFWSVGRGLSHIPINLFDSLSPCQQMWQTAQGEHWVKLKM